MGLLTLDSTNQQLSDLLDLVCVELQLTDTQHESATTSYEAVGKWLSQADTSLTAFRPEIFPQGSMSLLTTVKPRQREEFDVDLVCVLDRSHHMLSPVTVFNDVVNRLQENDTYRQMMRVEARCIILEYAGQYHLDIIPAVPAPEDGYTALVIPDRQRREWIKTNPKGFNRWFAIKATPMMERRAAASVQPLPANLDSGERTTLQRAVQLFKRRKDIHFDGGDDAPRSIVLTTLNGELYQQEELLNDAVLNILSRIEQRARSTSGIPIVPCPTNQLENLAREWQEDPARYAKFLEFVAVFQDLMIRLQHERSLEKIAQILNEMFDPSGTGVVTRAVKTYTDRYASARGAGTIRMTKSTSALTTAPVASSLLIPKNSFYGDVE